MSIHQRFTEEELVDLALRADPDQPISPDAVPFGVGDTEGLLPSWYMPKPGRATGWRVGLIGIIVILMLGTTILGLCVTYGFPEIGRPLP